MARLCAVAVFVTVGGVDIFKTKSEGCEPGMINPELFKSPDRSIRPGWCGALIPPVSTCHLKVDRDRILKSGLPHLAAWECAGSLCRQRRWPGGHAGHCCSWPCHSGCPTRRKPGASRPGQIACNHVLSYRSVFAGSSCSSAPRDRALISVALQGRR